MSEMRCPVANPSLVLREEFDDWAVLFDPDQNTGVGLSPVAVFVFKRLDGTRSKQDILSEIRANFRDVPQEADEHVAQFLDDVVERGFAGYEVAGG